MPPCVRGMAAQTLGWRGVEAMLRYRVMLVNVRQITSYFRYAVKSEEHVKDALECLVAAKPSQILPPTDGMGAVYLGGFVGRRTRRGWRAQGGHGERAASTARRQCRVTARFVTAPQSPGGDLHRGRTSAPLAGTRRSRGGSRTGCGSATSDTSSTAHGTSAGTSRRTPRRWRGGNDRASHSWYTRPRRRCTSVVHTHREASLCQ